MIDLIVPTIDGREDSLERCLRSFREHTAARYELTEIIVPESRTCGWGWQQGLAASEAPYVLLACDDQQLISSLWAEVCIETADEGLLPCPRVWHSDGSLESNGGDMGLTNHVNPRPQRDQAAVGYTTVPFMSREQAEAIGMLDVHYASDVWVSYRGRQLGYETILRHGFDLIHHREPLGRGAGMSVGERDALDVETVMDELERCESPSAAR